MEEQQKGFVKLHRSMLEWEWHDDPNMVSVWIHLLMMANWEQKRWHGIEIPPGSMMTSNASLSSITGIPVSTVKRCMDRLVKSEEIARKRIQVGTLVTIQKWALYQGFLKVDNSSVARGWTENEPMGEPKVEPMGELSMNTTKEYKEYKEIKEEEERPSSECGEAYVVHYGMADFEELLNGKG